MHNSETIHVPVIVNEAKQSIASKYEKTTQRDISWIHYAHDDKASLSHTMRAKIASKRIIIQKELL